MWQEIDRHITVNITKAFATSFSQSIFIPKCSNSVLSQSHSPPLALNNGITLHYRAVQSIHGRVRVNHYLLFALRTIKMNRLTRFSPSSHFAPMP